MANRARVEGAAAGRSDAKAGLPAKPRPPFGWALLAPGYMEQYLAVYRDAHRHEMWVQDRVRMNSEAKARRSGHKPASHPEQRRQALAHARKSQNQLRTKSQDDLSR